MDVAAARACRVLDGRFVPLPEDRPGRLATELPVGEGRLWINECRVERAGDRLRVHLAGRGWQWVERSSSGPLGSSFTVRGTVRFDAAVDFEGAVDLRYDETAHRASVVVTPADPRAQVTPIGTIPVAPDGGWSGLVGSLGGLFGLSPEQQARPMLEAEAAATLRRELGRGLTASFDLCTSQLDVSLGALGDGQAPPAHPYLPDGHRWVDNARIRVHAGGLDLSGPWDGEGGPLRIDIALEEGGTLEAAVLCRDEAQGVVASYLATGQPVAASGFRRRQVTASGAISFEVLPEECAAPYLLLTTTEPRVTARTRVRREGEDDEALADCE